MRRALAAFGALALLAATAGRAQGPAPLVLDGRSSLDYAAPNGLDASRDGTLEVWVAALWQEDPGYAPCLLASRASERDTHYSLHISGARDEVGLWNGSTWARAAFDFSDGEYHRIVVVTHGPGVEQVFDGQGRMRRTKTDPRTEIRVDGRSIATAPVGYGSARDLPFHVGSCDGRSGLFTGAVYSLRVWDQALPDDALAGLADLFGRPAPDHPQAAHLVAASETTPAGAALWLASGAKPLAAPPALPGGGAADAGSDDSGVPSRPREQAEGGPDTGGVWIVRDTRRFEKDHIEGVPDEEQDKYHVYPVYVFQPGDAEVVALASESAGGSRGRSFHDDVPQGGRVAELRVGADDEGIASLQLVVETGNGLTRELPVRGARNRGRVESIRLDPGEQLIGLSGSADDRVRSMRIHTTQRVSPLFGDGERGESFALWVPRGGSFTGLSGRALGWLGAVSLAYTRREPSLVLVGDDGTRRSFAASGPRAYRNGDSRLVFAGEDRFELDDRVFERVPPYPENEERGSYGDLYTVASQLYNAEFNFRSWDITQLDPWDYKQHGARGYVFAYPSETSRDWYVRNKAVVPQGMEFLAQDRGGTTTTTTTHSEESSYQQRLTRSISLGQGGLVAGRGVATAVAGAAMSAGRKVPTKALFKWNESYMNSVRNMYENETSYTFGEARIAAYTLVLDKARVKLDDHFRKRVEELAQTRDYAGFIKSYGTHYPYSITYGGLGIHQMQIDRSTYARMAQEQVRIDMDAMGTILGKITQGEKPKFDDFFSTDRVVDEESKRKLESQLDNFRWIGGAGGFSKETWNVNEKQTPIYLDLRFLDELLAPPHFTDPVIIGEVRQGLARAIDTYLEDVPPVRTDSIRPKLFEVVVESAHCVASSEIDRAVELIGSIAVRGYASGRKALDDPEGPLVWKRSGGGDDYTTIKGGSRHFFNQDRRSDESPRHVFSVSDEDLKLGYVQIEAKLDEYDPKGEQRFNLVTGGSDTVPMGSKKTGKLYFHSMKPGLAGKGTLEFKERNCSRKCAEVHVDYRYGRLD